MTITAAVALAVLQSISYVITGQFTIVMPKMVDKSGACVLGLLAGLLVWNFITLMIYVTPLSESGFFESLGFSADYERKSVAAVQKWCRPVNIFVASSNTASAQADIFDSLLKGVKAGADRQQKPQVEPRKTIEPPQVQPQGEKKPRPGLPPEVELQDIENKL